MKVLVYGFSKQKGGKEEYMLSINSQSINENVYFDYMVEGSECYYSNIINKYNGFIYYFNPFNFIDKIRKIRKIIKLNKDKYDYFYFNTSGLYFILPVIFAKMCGYKVIVHAHSAKEPNLKKIFLFLNSFNRFFINCLSDYKFSCSDLASNWIFGKNNKSVIQINNGIDTDKFKFNAKKRNDLRKKFNIKDDEIVLINVGRMAFPKNQEFLIDLMSNLNSKYKLFLVGGGPDYDYLLDNAKNKANIVFLGNRDDVNDLLSFADIFLLPSFYEGFPISAVEAQASGLYCILSDTITKQVKLSDSLVYAKLNDKDNWLSLIDSFKEIDRSSMSAYIKKQKFEKKDVAKYVLSFLKNK